MSPKRACMPVIFLIAILFTGCGEDKESEITQSGENLARIGRAIKEFQSERYFAHAPSSLEDLYQFKATLNPTLDASGVMKGDQRSISLISDPNIFLCPSLGKEAGKTFVSDYDLLSWYAPFLPDKTIIAWDKPGNFKSGGNVLYYDNSVEFLKMNPDEYKRFTEALQKKNDRDFVRSKSKTCSISGFAK